MSPHRGPPSFTPSPGIRALPAAAMETPDSGQLSRSEIARQIRANFDSLVRASPLPRVGHSASGAPCLWPFCRELHSLFMQHVQTIHPFFVFASALLEASCITRPTRREEVL